MKKALILLTLAAWMIFFISCAYGAGVSDDKADLEIPTLTKLHQEDPAAFPRPSSYDLKHAVASGANTVTKYLKDSNGTVTPVYYEVVHKTTGDSPNPSANPANNYYYKWADTLIGRQLVPATDESDADIIVYLTDKAAARITTNQSGADLTSNFAELNTSGSGAIQGGAIYNNSTSSIGDITGTFVGNYVHSTNNNAYGGAIDNRGTIDNIIGDFIGNYSNGSAYSSGGAIHNGGTINNIIGNFIGNYATSSLGSYSASWGGAIYNYYGTINNISGDFIGNYATSSLGSSASGANGGAIFNSGTIGNITGDFIGNYAFSSSSPSNSSSGGAIHNGPRGVMGNISGDFIGNYATSSGSSGGGAIYNAYDAVINNIKGDFIGNYSNAGSFSRGGAIYNDTGTINNITGTFAGNYANSTASYSAGGTINNNKTIGNITGDFIGNYANAFTAAYGGAIYNTGTIENIVGNFTGNYAKGASASNGGAIHNAYNQTIGNITGSFMGNYVETTAGSAYGGAIYNTGGTISNITGNFIGNHVNSPSNSSGGAIYSAGTIDITDSSFIDNYAQTDGGTAKGGAIYATGTINLTAQNKDVLFNGNYVSADGSATKASNAIHLGSTFSAANLNLNANTGKSIIFNDSITSEGDNNVININKADTGAEKEPSTGALTDGTIVLNADMSGFGSAGSGNAVNFHNGTIQLGKDFDYFGVPITVMAGGNQLLDISNNFNFDKINMNKFTLNNNLNVKMDVDLVNKKSDTFFDTPEGNEKFNLVDFNIMTHTNPNVQTDLLIADNDAMGYITLDDGARTAYTPIYKYDVSYNNTNGILSFGKGDGIDGFNPSVLAPSVAAQTGALFAQLASYQHGFKTLDTVAYMNSFRFNSRLNNNKYAGIQSRGTAYAPQEVDRYETANIWYQPGTVFEKVSLKNGPTVSNVEYNSYFGGDSKLYDLKNGWQGMLGIYGGYNGSHQTYQGTSVYQNGATLGLTGSLFKKDFYAGLTANAGALAGQANTMYGTDNFATLMTGTAVKAGYSLHSRESRFVVQPSMLVGYSFIKTFDYTSASNVRIHSSPISAVTLAPEVKLIVNLKDGWQPYASVSGWWNIMGESKLKANDVSLPELATKPYVQYGVGVQKLFTDNFSGFFQTMVRSGGRNGVGLNLGLNYALGKKALRL